jgi:hypothetical protein
MKKTPAQAVPLKVAAPPSMQHYFGQFFPSRSGEPGAAPADEYDATLLAEAGRISCHARLAVSSGDVQAAGMLRDAARLIDLYQQRQNARAEDDEARRQARKAARQ